MGLLIGYFSLAVTHNRRSFRSHSPKTISTPSMIFSSRSLNIRDVCLRQMSSAEKSVCTDCHTGSRNQTGRFSMKDGIYFAGMRIKILRGFLSVQVFQADVFVLHMHILPTVELQAKEPFGPARVVFQFCAQNAIDTNRHIFADCMNFQI